MGQPKKSERREPRQHQHGPRPATAAQSAPEQVIPLDPGIVAELRLIEDIASEIPEASQEYAEGHAAGFREALGYVGKKIAARRSERLNAIGQAFGKGAVGARIDLERGCIVLPQGAPSEPAPAQPSQEARDKAAAIAALQNMAQAAPAAPEPAPVTPEPAATAPGA